MCKVSEVQRTLVLPSTSSLSSYSPPFCCICMCVQCVADVCVCVQECGYENMCVGLRLMLGVFLSHTEPTVHYFQTANTWGPSLPPIPGVISTYHHAQSSRVLGIKLRSACFQVSFFRLFCHHKHPQKPPGLLKSTDWLGVG